MSGGIQEDAMAEILRALHRYFENEATLGLVGVREARAVAEALGRALGYQ